MSERNNKSAWQSLPWKEATKGEEVWLRGTIRGAFHAYGPHTIHDLDRKQIASGNPSRKGAVFMHYSEDLLVPRLTVD